MSAQLQEQPSLRTTFQRETVAACMDEGRPLLEAHWREIAHYQDIPLSVDELCYRAMDNNGSLRLYTARRDGKMIGYGVFMVRANPHYSTSLQAVQDILFVLPEYRASRMPLKFLRWCDEQLRADGVQVVYHHVKLAHDFGRLLQYIGYEPVETVYARRLDKWE